MSILSVSRRTDISTFFSEWFLNRLEEGRVMVRNPYNQQISDIQLPRSVIDCIVFWTKNPIPMLNQMDRLKNYPYYFQMTLTGYGKDLEANLPNKERLISAFRELYEKGNGNIIWRYDPIVFTPKYTSEWHLKTFERIATELKGYTEKCIISFVDTPMSVKKNMFGIPIVGMASKVQLADFCKRLAEIAGKNGMTVGTCAEVVNLEECGIEHNCCIDPDYIEKITGFPLKVSKDKGQRKECGCVESVEVGSYSTCGNGCKYCYACHSKEMVKENLRNYAPNSPLLCDSVHEDDVIKIRHLETMRKKEIIKTEENFEQLSLF